MDIALIADPNMLEGLHVTMYSCAAHYAGHTPITFRLFHDGLAASDIRLLRKTINQFDAHRMIVARFSPASVTFRSLHGNRMTYGKLFLPDLLPDCGRVLYLDSDLVVCRDLSVLEQVDFGGHPIAAVSGGCFRTALEQSFFAKLGFDLDTPCFNAGVLLFDLAAWRQRRLIQQCIEFGSRHSDALRAADQTLFNAVFYRDFAQLPREFNHSLDPSDQPIETEQEVIYHFIGSPKPFDLVGPWLHGNYKLYQAYAAKTAARRAPFRMSQLKRSVRTARSIWKALKIRYLAPRTT